MSSMFAEPAAAGSSLPYPEHLGALLMIDVHGVEKVNTSFGEKDAVRCDVTVVDGPGAPAEYSDTLVFPTVLVGALRPNIGLKVLGRLSQGNAKPGQKPPWKLESASPSDIANATAFVQRQTSGQFQQPAGGQPPF